MNLFNVFARIITLLLLSVTACLAQEQLDGESRVVSSFQEHMHSHLDQVSAIKSAVIAGNLAGVREPAHWLATHKEPGGLLGSWKTHVDKMQNSAQKAADAKDLATAAVAVSEIGSACGDCHQASGFSVSFGVDSRPPEENQSLMTQMQRHLWAADRMWEGLIGPSDKAWTEGTRILAEVQLQAADIDDTDSQVPELLQRVQQLGEKGANLPATENRGALYAEFLSQCASCHALTGGGPGN